VAKRPALHDLILSQTTVVASIHVVTVGLVGVADVGKAERATAVLVSSELGYIMLALVDADRG
jgi:hypothetical protein